MSNNPQLYEPDNRGWEANIPLPAETSANADELIAAIIRYVKTEISYYHRLLQVLQQERDILLSGQHDQLLLNCESKMSLSEELHDLQSARQELLAQFTVPDEGEEVVKLSQQLPLLEEKQWPEFRALLQEADILSRRLQDLNQINRTYINEALDSIGHILSIFTDQRRGVYNARGGPVSLSGRKILARKV
jgi:flagellar biosynthesis/type III secretory pathway chaperone